MSDPFADIFAETSPKPAVNPVEPPDPFADLFSPAPVAAASVDSVPTASTSPVAGDPFADILAEPVVVPDPFQPVKIPDEVNEVSFWESFKRGTATVEEGFGGFVDAVGEKLKARNSSTSLGMLGALAADAFLPGVDIQDAVEGAEAVGETFNAASLQIHEHAKKRMENYAPPVQLLNEGETFWDALSDERALDYIVQAGGENLPMLVGGALAGGSGALTAKLAGMGKEAIQRAVVGSGATFAFGLETGLSYGDLLKKGATPTEAAETSMQVGLVNAMLETVPIVELFKNSGILPKVRKKMTEEMTDMLSSSPQLRNQLWNIFKISALEGGTEALQEFVANVGKSVYDENQNLFEGMDESAFIGALLGGKVSTTVEVGAELAHWGRQAKKALGKKRSPLALPTLQQELETAAEAHRIQLERLDQAADTTLESSDNIDVNELAIPRTTKIDQERREATFKQEFETKFNTTVVQDQDGWKPLKDVDEVSRKGKVYLAPYGQTENKRLTALNEELEAARTELESVYDEGVTVHKARSVYNQIQELEAEKAHLERTLTDLPETLDGVRRTVQNYLKDMLPEYTVVITTSKELGGSAGSMTTDLGRKALYLALNFQQASTTGTYGLLNPNGSFKKGALLSVVNHEFGHALFHHYYGKAPLKVQAALEQEYLNFLQNVERTEPQDMGKVIDDPGSALQRLYQRRGFLPRDMTLEENVALYGQKPEERVLLGKMFSFDEWFAQQVAKHKAVKPNGASKLFNRVRAALKRFMRMHPEGFRPEATVDEWLESLSTGVALETAKRRVDMLTPQNVSSIDVATLTQDNEDVATEVYESAFGPPGVNTPTAAWTGDYSPAKELDEYRTDMSRFKRWALTLIQAADRNPHLESLQRFVDLASEYEKINREYHTKVDENLRRWRHLGKKQGAALSEFALEANRISYEMGRRMTDIELATLAQRMQGEQMTEETFAFYKELQAEFDNNLSVMQDAIEAQLERTMDTTTDGGVAAFEEAKEKLGRQVATARKRNYFPTSRFGDHTVTVRARGSQSFAGKDYNNEQVVVFETYPTAKLAERRQRQLKRQFRSKNYAVAQGKLTKYERDYVGLPLPLLQTMRELVPEDKRQDLDKAIARSLPGQGFAKRFAGFHGILGASKDGARSYANYTASFGRYLAKVEIADRMDKAISELEATVREVEMNEGDVTSRKELIQMMQHQREYIINPKYEWQWLSALSFNMYLAFIPGKILLNLLQIPTVVMPYLNTKYGEATSFKAMNKALKQAYDIHAHPERFDDHVLQAMQRLAEEGVTTQSMFHEMAGLESTGPLADRIPPGNTKQAAIATLRGISVMGSWMWNKSENIARTTTALAIYNMEIAKGSNPEQAYQAAKAGVRESMFEYSRWNRPRFMQGNLRAITIFYTHLQHMLEHLIGPHDSKWQVLGMLLVIGGLQGLPGMEDAQEMLTFIFRKLNGFLGKEVFPPNARLAFREQIQDIVTEITDDPQSMWVDGILRGGSRYSLGLAEAGKLAYEGLSAAGVDPASIEGLNNLPEFDLHSSVTLGRIVPGLDAINATDTNTFLSRLAQGTAGAGLGIPIGMVKALYDTNATDMSRMRSVFPAFLNYPLKAYEYAANEAEIDAKGNHLVRFDLENQRQVNELIAQSLGLNVTRVNVAKEANWAFKDTRMYYQRRRAEFYRLYAEAIMEGDGRGIQEIVSRVHRFNKDAPVWARVNSQDFKAGVENRVLSKVRAKAGLPTGAGVRDIEIKRAIDQIFPQRDE